MKAEARWIGGRTTARTYVSLAESDIVFLLGERVERTALVGVGIGSKDHINVLNVIGVDAIGVVIFVLFVATRSRRATGTLSWNILDAREFAKHSSMINVRKITLLIGTCTCVSIIRAFSYMTLSAASTLLAEAESRKIATHVGIFVDVHVGIAALGIRTVATQEMDARRGATGARIMRKVATSSSRTGSLLEKHFANGDFARIVGVFALISVHART
jgi:hypothetical protein